MKKIPMRTCIVTKEKLPKKDLIRIVKYNDVVSLDASGKANGKGCYLKKDKEVVEKAKKTKVLDRVFDTKIDEKLYDEILKNI